MIIYTLQILRRKLLLIVLLLYFYQEEGAPRCVTNPRLSLDIGKIFYREFHTSVMHMGAISLNIPYFPWWIWILYLLSLWLPCSCYELLEKLRYLLFEYGGSNVFTPNSTSLCAFEFYLEICLLNEFLSYFCWSTDLWFSDDFLYIPPTYQGDVYSLNYVES